MATRYLHGLAVSGAILVVSACSRSPEGVRLFDGETLSGWEGDTTRWRVHEGAIVGGTTAHPAKESTYLCTQARYDDFELSAEVRLVGYPNGGITFRAFRVPGSTEVGGFQADIGAIEGWIVGALSDEVKPADSLALYPLWGALLDEFRTEPGRYRDSAVPYRLLAMPDRETVDRVVKPDDWNTLYISAVGNRIAIRLNEVPMIEYVETQAVATSGPICLQTHEGSGTEARYRNLVLEAERPTS